MPENFYDSYDIAMDWFIWHEPGESDEGEGEPEESEPQDSFDTATAELPEDFQEIDDPWWVESEEQFDSSAPPSIGVHGEEVVGTATRFVQRFANTTEFLNYIYQPLELAGRYSTRDSKNDQCLGLNWTQARAMADNGWAEGVEHADRIAAKLRRVISGAIREPVISYGVRGPRIDMGKFLTGDPRHMWVMSESDRIKLSKKPKLIRIVTTVDIASTEGFINRGAAICALTQLLQRHGIRVQIDVHVGTDDKIDTWVRVKDADRGVDIESLIFFTAHPVMFWRYAYAAWEHAPSQWRGGVGTSDMGYISEPVLADRGDIYVSALGSHWKNTEAQVLTWVVEQLQAHGIEVELEAMSA